MTRLPSAGIESDMLLHRRYRLGALVGQGGMGAVYEAEDIELGRRVAIKVMHEEMDEEFLERLFREARAAARSDHPVVVTTYDCGTDPEHDISYVVMEYLRGETVAQRIERTGPLPPELVLRLAFETADALSAVHATGVIHRDIKPSNLFLSARSGGADQIKLLDFGVAKLLDLETLTATGQVYGTLRYMAPEQLLDSKRIDARSDLYSLGALLWECLTGKPLFAATNVIELVAAIQFGPDPQASELGPGVPAALAAVIERCLRKRASDRFPDGRAICAALRDAG